MNILNKKPTKACVPLDVNFEENPVFMVTTYTKTEFLQKFALPHNAADRYVLGRRAFLATSLFAKAMACDGKIDYSDPLGSGRPSFGLK